MFKCNVCGCEEFYEDNVKKVFEIDSEIVVIENLPAKICKKCGEENFSRDTLKNIQNLVYNKPSKTIIAKSFEYV